MPDTENEDPKQLLLDEIDLAMMKYRSKRLFMTILQWILLLSVAIAGFFTTAAGTTRGSDSWYSSPGALVTWGLISAIGAIIIQNLNPGKLAESLEQKKDAMRAIRTAVNYRGLDLVSAAEQMEMARQNPLQALDNLSAKALRRP